MERIIEGTNPNHRVPGLGLVLAFLATTFLFTSVTLVFTAGATGTRAAAVAAPGTTQGA